MPFIEITDLTYTYPLPGGQPIPALRGISLNVEEGEYVAIIGANGSGKSTLARCLNALLLPTSGRVLIAGLDTRHTAHWQQIRTTIGMVFQFPEDQMVATVVEEDVAFGPENLGLPPEEIRRRVREALETVALWDQRHRPPHLLSAGQMQRVALAGTLAMRPRCIVFDEATAMLDPAGRRAVLEMMARLHREGLTILTITHFMEEAAQADRVIALQNGRVALDGSPQVVFSRPAELAELGLDQPPAAALANTLRHCLPALPPGLLTVEAVVAALVGLERPLSLNRPAPAPPGLPPSAAEQPPYIDVVALGHIYLQGTPLERRALADVNLAVAEREAHGLLGTTGSGKSTVMQHLNGLLRPQEGHVRIGPYDLNAPDVDLKAVRRTAGLAFQIPEMQIFEQYVGDEIAYGPRLLGVSGEALREAVRWAMELVGLDFAVYKDRLTFALSGGERRKVALASILALRPRVLLLDEPTAGLDPAARRELLGRLKGLRTTGLTLVFASHQMEDLAALADRLTVLADGRDVLHGSVGEVFAQGALLRPLNLEPPVVTQVAEGLRAHGWALPAGITDARALIAALATAGCDPQSPAI